jgi:hypothetical protein
MLADADLDASGFLPRLVELIAYTTATTASAPMTR